MKLKRIGSSSAQVLTIENGEVLISYSTPVAARIIGPEGATWYRTSQHFSVTTSKHINKFLPKDFEVETMPQEFFENLIKL